MTDPWHCPICKQHWEEEELLDGLCPGCLISGYVVEKRRHSGTSWGKSWDPPLVEDLQPLFADYEILSLIGRGGMGAVYQATQKRLSRLVAIKILPPGLGWNPAFKERFQREATMLARLNHPGIVTIHDSGQSQDLYYLVMEYVKGETLRDYVAINPISPRQVLELGVQLCRIMEIAHENGIVHRDLKLENILVPSLDQVKIADFGIAKLFGEQHADDPATVAASHVVAGTSCFMAPEQQTHPDQVDDRADIYSLGIILYLLLTSGLPEPEPAPPSQILPGLGSHVDALVMRAIEKNPTKRHQNMKELRQELELVLAAEKQQELAAASMDIKRARRSRNLLVWGTALACIVGMALWTGSKLSKIPGLSPGRLPTIGQSFDVPLDETVRLAMRPIPAGTFAMGSPPDETPEQHPTEQIRQVQISRPFWMGTCEVTQAQYQVLMGTSPSFFQVQNARLPVERVSWIDATRFCEILTTREQKAGRVPKDYLYRLPTEAEWEYAARAGGKSVALTDETVMGISGWHARNSDKTTHPVGQKQANAWGLHDLFGNVSEWCLDSWNNIPESVTASVDPVWRPGKDFRAKIYRGGDFLSDFFRSAHRNKKSLTTQISQIGFRVVLAPVNKSEWTSRRVSAYPSLGAMPPETDKAYSLVLPQDAALEMLPISAGEFFMGSPPEERYRSSSERQHLVKISSPFWMGRTEVTQAQYESLMESNPSLCRNAGLNAPVENVSWYAAMDFCNKLTIHEQLDSRLPEGMVYRLPTEAEWEYACRTCGKTPPIIDGREEMNLVGWNSLNSEGHPHPVGEKLPNAWGIQDMFGNVSEWCLDRWSDLADAKDGVVDPLAIGLNTQYARSLRGARYDSRYFRCADRYNKNPSERNGRTGFRIVLAQAMKMAEAGDPEMIETMKQVNTLTQDAQGFRQLPMTPDWWRGSQFEALPDGIKAKSLPTQAFIEMRHVINACSNSEFSLKWKIGGFQTTDTNALNVIVGLDALDDLSLTQGRMIMGKGSLGFVPIKPDTWYCSTLKINPEGMDGTIVVSLFDGTGETLLKQWVYPISNATRINLKHTRLRIQANGNTRNIWIQCSEAKIRLNDASK